MNFISTYIKKFVNIKIGLAGAIIMGAIVFFVNLNHGWEISTVAGLKQFAYTFLFGGAIIKLLENIILKIDNKNLAVLYSVVTVSIVTIILVFLVHSMKGTPEPLLSTLPTILMAPPGFLLVAIKFKRDLQNQ